MKKTFLAADYHFFHNNIILYCNRPYRDEYEMNEILVNNHNSVVSKDDTVIILGDLSAGLKGRNKEFKEIVQSLNGNKILLRGNHDHLPDEFYLDAGIERVGHFLKIGKYFLNHYGLINNKYTKGTERRMIQRFKNTDCDIIIHGHKHIGEVELNEENGFNERINVAMDMNNYIPVEFNFDK